MPSLRWSLLVTPLPVCSLPALRKATRHSYAGCTLYNPGTPFMAKGPSTWKPWFMFWARLQHKPDQNQAVGQNSTGQLKLTCEWFLWVRFMVSKSWHSAKSIADALSKRTSVIPSLQGKEEGSVFLIPLGLQSTEWLTSHVTPFWFLCMLPNYTQFLKVLSLLCFFPKDIFNWAP